MTTEKAIKLVKEVTGMSLPWDDEHYEALQMAIAALEHFSDEAEKQCEYYDTESNYCAFYRPAVAEMERKDKEWIYPTDIIGFGRCPECHALWDISLIENKFFKYCPRCGTYVPD